MAEAFDAMPVESEKGQAEADGATEALRQAHAELATANTALTASLGELHEQNAHLRASQAQLAAIIGSATDAIVTIDDHRRVVLFNREAERIFQLPAAEILGQPVERLIPERYRATLRSAARGGATGSADGTAGPAAALRADGEEFPIEAATSSATVEGKTLFTIILRDVTEQRRGEAALRKLSRAVEQTAEGVYITDRHGVIEYVNPAFEAQTGYERAEVIGQTPSILKSGEHDKEFYERLWETILSGQVFREVFINRKKTGEAFYDLQTITPVRDDQGNISHFVASSRDITHRMHTKAALIRLNAQLEREAERIAHALHDEAGQFLTAAHIVLAEVARDLPPQAQQRLQEVRQHLNQVEEQLRSLSHELRPRILEDLGLRAALEFLADGVSKRTGCIVTMRLDMKDRLPPILETAIYRLVR